MEKNGAGRVPDTREPTGTRRRTLEGTSLLVGSQFSIQFGASLGALVMPIVGPLAVVTVRQLVTVAFLLPFYRPKRASFRWTFLWPAIALGVVLACMNLTFYASIERLGLGTAATIEFLGPLALALFASRRIIDLACAVGAGVGVFLLTGIGGTADPLGLLLAAIAATSWAGYILLTRSVATHLPGLEGLSIASIVAAILLVPCALAFVDLGRFNWSVIGLCIAAGVLSSAIPYSADTFILRRITARLYSVLTSISPAIAALFGWLVLAEHLTALEGLGITIVCCAAAVAIATQPSAPTLSAPLDPESASRS